MIFVRYHAWMLLLLAAGLSGLAEDAAVRTAPEWDCGERSLNAAHMIWRAKVCGNQVGFLALGNGRVLVGSTEWTACAMNAFDTSGHLLWCAKHLSLDSRVHDYGAPLRCRACIDGDRAYYMSNRGEIVCADLKKSYEGDDAEPPKDGATRGAEDAPILWKVDLMKDFGVFKRDWSDVGNPLPSPLVIGDLVFCVTAHGVPPERQRADPKPPSFIAFHKLTGKIAWSSNAPGANIVFSQWSSPVSASINGFEEVIFPGGDGVLYGFEPATGRPLWEFDCNRLGARDRFREDVGWEHLVEARCGFFATPTVHGTMLYVALNENYEQPTPHPLLAIDLAAADGPKIVWQFGGSGFKGTYHSAAVDGGFVFVTGDDCVLFALDEKTGRECWRAEIDGGGRDLCAAPVIYQGRVYAGGETTITVFEASREKKCLGKYEFDDAYPATPQFDGDKMFVAVGEYVFALRLP